MRVQVCRYVVGAPGIYVSLLHGNREISDTTRRRWRVASGRLIVKADDVRYGEVRPAHTAGEAGEQSGETSSNQKSRRKANGAVASCLRRLHVVFILPPLKGESLRKKK